MLDNHQQRWYFSPTFLRIYRRLSLSHLFSETGRGRYAPFEGFFIVYYKYKNRYSGEEDAHNQPTDKKGKKKGKKKDNRARPSRVSSKERGVHQGIYDDAKETEFRFEEGGEG